MTRSVDASLAAALLAGSPTPYIKGTIGYTDGTVIATRNAINYKLTGTTLEMELAYNSDMAGDQTACWLERGLTIGSTNYTNTTGRFFITSQKYLPNGHQIVRGSILPNYYYAGAGHDTYQNVITAICANAGKTAVFKDPAAAWLNYIFYPTGALLNLFDMNQVIAILRQKYLIYCCDNGSEEILFYDVGHVFGAADHTIALLSDFNLEAPYMRNRQFVWKDESNVWHQDGTATDPIHNLGYMETGAAAPARHTPSFNFDIDVRPNLAIMDGDTVTCTFLGGSSTKFFPLVIEEFKAGTKNTPPVWRTHLTANKIFENTEGGSVSNVYEGVYVPLQTGAFGGILSANTSNVQSAFDVLDDHTHIVVDVIGSHGANAVIAAKGTSYLTPCYPGLNAAGYNMPWQITGTLRVMRLKIESAQPGTGNLVVTLQVGSADTAITFTIPAGSGAGSYVDNTHNVTFYSGNNLRFKIYNDATANSAQIGGLSIRLENASM